MNSQEKVLLAPLTTFCIGGPARFFGEAKTEEDIRSAITFAQSHNLALLPLGGGANLLVPDNGVEALVLKIPCGRRGDSSWTVGN